MLLLNTLEYNISRNHWNNTENTGKYITHMQQKMKYRYVKSSYNKTGGIRHGVYSISHNGWVVDQNTLTLVQPRPYPLTRCEAVSNPY